MAYLVKGNYSYGRHESKAKAQANYFKEAKGTSKRLGGWVKGSHTQAIVFDIGDVDKVWWDDTGTFNNDVTPCVRLPGIERLTFDCDTGQVIVIEDLRNERIPLICE